MAAGGVVTVRTNLGNHSAFMPIKSGALSVPDVRFDFCGPKSPPAGFRDMVRDGAYEVGELALGTYLQAVCFSKPLILLPVTIMARLQHRNLVCRSNGYFGPGEIAGKRVGVRSYSQTTGIWVRGLLKEAYGIEAGDVTWICTENPHLAEYVDPANVHRLAVSSDQIGVLLADGTIDGAIFGADLPMNDPGIVPVIADPHAAALAWYEYHRFVPINHMLAVTQGFAERYPERVRAIYAAFVGAAETAPRGADGIDFFPRGFDEVRAPVEAMIEHAMDQKIIPHRLSFEDVFGAAERLLAA